MQIHCAGCHNQDSGKQPVLRRAGKTIPFKKGKLNLGDADVIISAGRGIRNPENLHLLEELAKIFPKSALGSSKGAYDLG